MLALLRISACTAFSIFCVLVCASEESELPVYHCPFTSTPDLAQHEKFLDQLSGKRILFVGDSVTRLQYITLSSFLAKGLCPDKENESRRIEYADLYYLSKGWDEFYQASSSALITPLSSEICLCTREDNEFRSFTYEDEQGRRIQLQFMMYMDESVRPLQALLQAADALLPNFVVINFGLWLLDTDTDCGQSDGESKCPYLPKVCEFITQEQPFKVIWMTTTPMLEQTNPTMGPIVNQAIQHHLHLPRVCQLAASAFLNRGAVLHALEPDEAERKKLYLDHVHFTPAAYHSFNGLLMEMITGLDLGHGQQAESSK